MVTIFRKQLLRRFDPPSTVPPCMVTNCTTFPQNFMVNTSKNKSSLDAYFSQMARTM